MHPLSAKAEQGVPSPAPRETIILEIQRIRRDGGTQGRVSLNQYVVEEYAELMRAGTEFPPVRTWFDGDNYWLSDGFQRVAAAELNSPASVRAEVFCGTLEDAKWDSYAANSRHGSRRARADIEAIMKRAWEHPRASVLSVCQIALHLNIPEATLRRWRKGLSSPSGEDATRIAVRHGKAYCIDTTRIGKERSGLHSNTRSRSWERLRQELCDMNELASPGARTLICVFQAWIVGKTSLTVCLEGLEGFVQDSTPAKNMANRSTQVAKESSKGISTSL